MSDLTWLGVYAWVVLYQVTGSLWRKHRVAVARQSLFEIRDDLFIEALSYKTEADRAAAREVRRVINSVIRYAHRVSFTSVMAYTMTPELRQVGEVRVRERSNVIAQSTKAEHLNAILERVNDEIHRILLHRSLILLAILFTVMIVHNLLVMIERVFKRQKNSVSQPWKKMQGISRSVSSIAEIDSLTTRYT
jgi:cell division protein ZapA (FtsZ GTPase activity inhibitor)